MVTPFWESLKRYITIINGLFEFKDIFQETTRLTPFHYEGRNDFNKTLNMKDRKLRRFGQPKFNNLKLN